jgi:hypothetical protein
MKKTFFGLGALIFLLFAVSSHSVAGTSSQNGSPQMNQAEPSANAYQYQYQQSNPMNEPGSGPSAETPPGARNGTLSGIGPFLNVTGAEPFTVAGTVVSCIPGSGLELQLASKESIYIFGIGPTWFWDAMGILRPIVGDVIEVVGFTVDYSGTLRNIAQTITCEEAPDNPIVLRDEAGYPLWRADRALQIRQAN